MTPTGFIHGLAFADLPDAVLTRAKHCLLDLIGVAASGSATDLSRIVRDHAARHMGAGGTGGATLLFDGRRASAAGAAFAGASAIDSFDAHDGHALTKGHAGVAVLPALLALAEETSLQDGREFAAALVLGYEIATRAGIALHGSVPDYHTSGAWNALGCAAIGARLLRLGPGETRHALGIAEYHGPRSQMMRCIAHPTMLKDGSGWGAFAGVTAAFLAEDGFTGAPAITIEAEEQARLWGDLGGRWMIAEQYFKPQPVCRWAQPAIEAAALLRARPGFDPAAIRSVEVRTFAAAVALGTARPASTEEAQYALGFPLACLLARGRVGGREISGEGLADPAVLAMLGRIALAEEADFTRRFPAERLAVLRVTNANGQVYVSPPTSPRGNPEAPLPDVEIRAKFRENASRLGPDAVSEIEALVDGIDRRAGSLDRLLRLLGRPIAAQAARPRRAG